MNSKKPVSYDFTDKVVLISGAGSGFGKLAAQRFSAAGAKLSLADISEDEVCKVASDIQTSGGTAQSSQCDVTRASDVQRWIEETVSSYGSIHIAINNAGVVHSPVRIADISEDDFDQCVAVDLKGVFLCMKFQLPVMLEQGSGVIVNIASAAGLVGAPMLGAYAAAKHAVVGLTKSAAVEYGRKGLRINALCPAFSATPLLDGMVAARGEQMVANIANSNPMQRLVEPDEVVDALMWLSSDASSFVNGVALPVDGGLSSA